MNLFPKIAMNRLTSLRVRPHDLLELKAPALVAVQGEAKSAAPAWVAERLRLTPCVVVRRGIAPRMRIPIGVRGTERHQRWAAYVAADQVRAVMSPPELLNRWQGSPSREAEIGAFRSLRTLLKAWQHIGYLWGPGGSIGFELGSGVVTAKPSSDLDIVLYANERLPLETAHALLATTHDLPTCVDVRVETHCCGFSLTEYAEHFPRPILLRTPHGPRLGRNPWSKR